MKNYKSSLIFVVVLILVSLLYNYHHILFLAPSSYHQWRQTDCTSIALNYLQEGMSFFHPTLLWCGNNKNGEAVSEFPIIYYTVAALWKVFGQHDFIFRLLNLLIVFTGLFFLFKTLEGIFKDSYWAIAATIFIFTSPVLVFYSNNFMPDAPGFSLALIGWYFFYRFYKSEKDKFLYFSLMFFALGGLIKVSSAISVVAIALVFFIELLGIYRFKDGEKIFKTPKRHLLVFMLFGTVLISWYKYASFYNIKHTQIYFMNSISPIWELEKGRIREISILLYNELLPQLFSSTSMNIVLLMLLTSILLYKRANKFLLFLSVVIFTGGIIFILLWYKIFNVHDYYLTNLLIVIVIVLVTFMELLKRNFPELFSSIALKTVFGIILLFNIYYCAVNTRVRYNSLGRLVKYSYILDRSQVDYWNWYHWDYNLHLKAFETIKPYIRSLGIKREDRVISIPDQSPDITLYFMDQKGYTDMGCMEFQGADRIRHFIFLGAKYLVINNQDLYKEDYLKPFIKNKIGSYKNIDIYDLRNL